MPSSEQTDTDVLDAPDAARSTAQSPAQSVAVRCQAVGKVYDRDPGRRWLRAVPGLGDRPRTPLAALSDVDLDITAGSTIGIVGPNGAGKSTLLKVIAGITAPSSGTVAVNGSVRSIIELGMGFHPDLTGWENLRCSGVMLGWNRDAIDEVLDAMVDFAGIRSSMDRPLKQYSLGMQARLAVALATHGEVDVLAVDEVLAVGDRDFQIKCIDRIMRMVDAGTTLIFVSHQTALIGQVCERSIHMRDGRVVDDGTSSEVITRYLSRTANRYQTLEHPSATVDSLDIPDGIVSNDGLHLVAEIDVHEPIERPAVGLDFKLPMVDPDLVVVSSIVSLPRLTPGRYRLSGIGNSDGFRGRNLRAEVTLIDRAEHRKIDSAWYDLEQLGVGRIGELGPNGVCLVLPLTWEMHEAEHTSGPTLDPVRPRGTGPASPAPGASAISVRHASKRYRAKRNHGTLGAALPGRFCAPRRPEIVALDQVMLEVAPGESLGVIGSNGAGKTTLLRVIAGITELDMGGVTVNGRVAPVIELGAGFHPELTGRENIWMVTRLMGVPREHIGANAEAIIDFAGIRDAIDAPLKQYSTGMKARLGLAIALHVPSEILAIDEMLSVGDQEFRLAALEAVNERHRDGKTIVFVSHELQLIEQACERVVRLERGALVDDGDTDSVVERYAGRSWAGGVHDASGGIRLQEMTVERQHVSTGDTLELSGTVVVDEPVPGAHLELALRAIPPDRSAVLTLDDRLIMSVVVETVVPAGAELAQRGVYRYRCSVVADHVVGALDAVLTVVDEHEGIILGEVWREVTIGTPEAGAFPTVELDMVWDVEPLSANADPS